MQERIIGVMGAMPEEIDGVIALLTKKKEFTHGMRSYYTGKINNVNAVVVFSRWGKVAAATTVSTLILEFGITELLFTGVAGAINESLNVGDIVIGSRFFQHDMDARPLLPQFEIPLIGQTFIQAPALQLNIAKNAVEFLLENRHLHEVFQKGELELFNILKPRLFLGDIASGDQFFSSNSQKENLRNLLPEVLCVEMEGAAVAQVCFEYEIPFTIIRTISDVSDDNSHIDFPLFITSISSRYSVEIVKNLFKQLQSLN